MITALVIVGILLYGYIGLTFKHVFYRKRLAACPNHGSWSYCYDDHEMASVFAGILWPIILPVFLVAGPIASAFRGINETSKKMSELVK